MTTVTHRIEQAARVTPLLAALNGAQRSALLAALADALDDADRMRPVLEANALDLESGEAAMRAGDLSPALVARLRLAPSKLANLSDGLRTLATQPELVNARVTHRELAPGLVLEQRRHPLGVIGVVFEARPDALPQIVGLALKSGNAIVLKGGSEAARTNAAMTIVIHNVLREAKLPVSAVTLLEDRAEFRELLTQVDSVDLLVARGSGAFVRMVQGSTKIPVLGHAEGLCHIYIHGDANPQMAASLVVDAKTTYPAACNAVETLLWHSSATQAIDATIEALHDQGVELRGCEATMARHPQVRPATEDDWGTEYSELVLSVRAVENLDAALAHIRSFGSGHTEAILTEEAAVAELFMHRVDAACIFHNASTRFSDGLRFGLGGEVGISTGKLHARGPVGVEGLMTTRWLLRGHGDLSADFDAKTRTFTHRDM